MSRRAASPAPDPAAAPLGAGEPVAKRARAGSAETEQPGSDAVAPGATAPDGAAAADGCTTYEEFRSTLGYFFTLFQRPFPAALEQGTRDQFDALGDGDLTVRDDGGNNPEVTMRLDPVYMARLCDALEDADGALPSISVPRSPEQTAFWQGRVRADAGGCAEQTAAEEAERLSERSSHWETLREALAWRVGAAEDAAQGGPLRVFVLGASARYEYGGLEGDGTFSAERSARALLRSLASVAGAAAPGRGVEFLLCGRDVPAELDGAEHHGTAGGGGSSSAVSVKHRVGYLHCLPDCEAGVSRLRGALFVALHAGLGLDHPELAGSWPPTLQRLRQAAPVWLALSSFNQVEHGIAAEKLRTSFPGQLETDRTGVNPAGSLEGPDTIGPFDGLQGKRNYCVLHSRVVPLATTSDGWDLFD